jgi:molecular chaperone GrpE
MDPNEHDEDKCLPFQEDAIDSDEIEIIEVVGLEEDSPAARPARDEDLDELVLEFEQESEAEARGAGVPVGSVERESFLRLQADFENFKRRAERERQEIRRRAARGVVGRLLPVLDNFERAVSVVQPGADDNGTFREGVLLIFRQLLEELRKEGLAAIDSIGQPFDPHLHDAVATDYESGLPSQTVVEELQRGYLLNGRVLRPALVKVAMDRPEKPESGDAGEES